MLYTFSIHLYIETGDQNLRPIMIFSPVSNFGDQSLAFQFGNLPDSELELTPE